MHHVWPWLIAISIALLGVVGWVFIGSVLLAYFCTHPPRRVLRKSPADFGASFEDISFPSLDGVTLSGWFIHCPVPDVSLAGVVVLCHGMMADRAEGLPWVEAMLAEGLSVLTFDFRASGTSGGQRSTAGLHEPLDLRGAIEYVSRRPDCAGVPMGVFGFSMGGAAAIMAAADEERIRAVATHGAFASLDRAILQRCRKVFGPLSGIAMRLTVFLGRHWFPFPTALVSPLESVSRLSPRPLMILHGERDRVVPASDARDLHEAAGQPKSLHLLKGSGHRRIRRALREEARVTVARFFRDSLAAPDSDPCDDEVTARHSRNQRDEPH